MNRISRAVWSLSGLGMCCVLLTGQAGAQVTRSAAPVVRSQQLQPAARAVLPVFFGTVPVRVSAKRFEIEWTRARRNASAMPEMQRLIAAAVGMPRLKQIVYVQSAVTRRIGWRSDTTQYGRHDYWASAEETLRSGRGDMEDRAILKMQALRALGFSTRDLYLTLGRDTVGGPQALLIARVENSFYILDDAGGPPYTPGERPEFRPAFTFGWGASWVHMPRHNERAVATADAGEQLDGDSGGQ